MTTRRNYDDLDVLKEIMDLTGIPHFRTFSGDYNEKYTYFGHLCPIDDPNYEQRREELNQLLDEVNPYNFSLHCHDYDAYRDKYHCLYDYKGWQVSWEIRVLFGFELTDNGDADRVDKLIRNAVQSVVGNGNYYIIPISIFTPIARNINSNMELLPYLERAVATFKRIMAEPGKEYYNGRGDRWEELERVLKENADNCQDYDIRERILNSPILKKSS